MIIEIVTCIFICNVMYLFTSKRKNLDGEVGWIPIKNLNPLDLGF